MDKVILHHIVKKEKEGTYYKLPFQVPEKTRSVRIAYSYSKANGNVIDLGLEDEKGQFLGWSGGSRSSIHVSEYDATPGYFMEEVKSGEWNILIGAYHVPTEGVEVCYEITFEKEGYLWLFGDLHTHSDASDGQFDIPTLGKMAKDIGLNFLAVTNHNNYSENFSLPKIPGLTLIPGVEWTHYRGHMNFLGIRQPFFNSFVANDIEQMEQIAREARVNGALISVNHPKCPMCPYLWENETDFQLIEIWNGPMRQANIDAIYWWNEFLKQGRQVSAVGGSDYHRENDSAELGKPVTAVYAKSPLVEDIMDAIKKGHSYVTESINGVKLVLDCEGKSFGDEIESGEEYHVHAEAWDMPDESMLKLIDRTGTVEEVLCDKNKISIDTIIKAEEFLYLIAVQKTSEEHEQILAVSNPVYFKKSGEEV